MHLIVQTNGDARCLYGEAIDLTQLGQLVIQRGSFVEPDNQGQWRADLAPCAGPSLGPFALRSQALAAEETWLLEHWLTHAGRASDPLEAEQMALAIIA
jgi:hypothetical protein